MPQATSIPRYLHLSHYTKSVYSSPTSGRMCVLFTRAENCGSALRSLARWLPWGTSPARGRSLALRSAPALSAWEIIFPTGRSLLDNSAAANVLAVLPCREYTVLQNSAAADCRQLQIPPIAHSTRLLAGQYYPVSTWLSFSLSDNLCQCRAPSPLSSSESRPYVHPIDRDRRRRP